MRDGRPRRLARGGRRRNKALEVSAFEGYEPPRMRSAVILSFALVAAFGSIACRRGAAREWRPEDHDQEQSGTAQMPANADAAPNPNGAESDLALLEAAWTSNCAQCHGRMGLGDGPQGPMVKAPNLTDPAVVDRFSDAELLAIIKAGRNKMPAFPSLPDRIAQGLVARVRANEKH